ncbi:MAG TPA: DUF6677 family protein [Sumerlaeia bacterium]|nr:DUF6677 family protein [Sumerlaeia bacterium]
MTTKNAQPSPRPRPVSPFLLVALGWLIPGSGFLLLGRKGRARGLIALLAIHLTFIVGVSLKGGVVWPVWAVREAGFNLINILTFLVEMGAGWLAALSLAAHAGAWAHFAPAPANAYFELGSLYCLTAGALNYFVIRQSQERNEKKAFEILAKQ